ncbi:hypothetical protein [Candidatus Accumulibacter sp. ACC007]|uniref:hypothetical protein n=1 Tax=Candidatus Accumulibacter sp. ACC007 TaxID=2823333 RepID=UPI0025BA8CF3|nr:hypothetical protein [Candidatus Accumulibacter sp. ACC007]
MYQDAGPSLHGTSGTDREVAYSGQSVLSEINPEQLARVDQAASSAGRGQRWFDGGMFAVMHKNNYEKVQLKQLLGVNVRFPSWHHKNSIPSPTATHGGSS